MSASDQPYSLHLRRMRPMIAALSERQFLMVAVHPGAKNPIGDEWQKRATDDPGVLDDLFSTGSNNLGVACGPQPNGINLVCIDVDTKYDGLAKWAELVDINGIPQTAMHMTPSGGLHIFFNAPTVLTNSRGGLPKGIDVRGLGGQVVVPPSVRAIDGSVKHYEAIGQRGLWQYPVAPMPQWLVDLLTKPEPEPEIERSIERHPSHGASSAETPADWVRAHLDFTTYLIKHGWVHVRFDSWRRPDKEDRGTSAELKNDGAGPLNIFTTDIPEAVERLGKMDRTGQCVSISLFDFIAAYEFDGDRSACASWVRRTYMSPAKIDVGTGERAAAPAPMSDGTSSLFLPDDFWSATPLLSEVRRVALSKLRCPDAMLAALLTMYATTIPMNIWLPGIVGAQAPLNLFAIVVGRSGGGKSSAMTNASKLMGSPGNADILLRKSLRSGEGLIPLVNKKRKKGDDDDAPVATNVGVHVHYDEGGTLSKQTNQSASTIIPYLNTAWSGAGTVGGAKADGDQGFDASRVRICALIGVQYGIGANLFTGEAATLGFPQRLLFLSADDHPAIQDQEMPDEIVEPEPLGLPFLRHADFIKPTFVDLPKAIRQEVWDWSKTIPDPLDGHAMNQRLRIATVLMLIHGAGDTAFEPWWELSEAVMTTHRDVRHAFIDSIHKVDDDRDVALGRSLGRRAQAQRDFDLDRAVESLLTKLGSRTLSNREIKDHLASWKKNYGFTYREVLDRALLLGRVVESATGWCRS